MGEGQLQRGLKSRQGLNHHTWANQSGQEAFCLGLATATDPFRTCLIGMPCFSAQDFKGLVKNMGRINKGTEDVNEMCWALYNNGVAHKQACLCYRDIL